MTNKYGLALDSGEFVPAYELNVPVANTASMSTIHLKALLLADAYAEAAFDQGLKKRTLDDAPEKARSALGAELLRLQADLTHADRYAEQLGREIAKAGAEIADLESQLVKEAARTASEKLRADQMAEQHRMQAAMNTEARAELALMGAANAGSEAVAYVDGDEAHRRILWEPNQAAFDLPVGSKLYTHTSPPEGMAGWQSIETAPKDGRTLLLGYRNQCENWRTVRGQWMDEDYIHENWEEPDNGEPGWFETSVNAEDPPNCWCIDPSHWMLLPPPPLASEAKGESHADQA